MIDVITLIWCVTVPFGFSGLVWFFNRYVREQPEYMTLDTLVWSPQQDMWVLEDRFYIEELKPV